MGERDPLARRSPRLMGMFGQYLRWYFARHFRAVRISRAGPPVVPEGRPIIIYSNHPSWWDPALFILLDRTVFAERTGFGPMDADALRHYPILRRMGVFGIEAGTARGSAEFLRVARRVLADPRGTLWVTAEGRFTDPRQRPVRLRPGIAHLARHMPEVALMPMAIEYAFWNESRPEALVRFGAPIEPGRPRDVAGWTALLTDELTRTMDALAAESMTRDAGLFRPLVEGSAGIGGVYDAWRRVRAWRAGRRFDPSHAAARRPAGGAS